MTTFRDKAESSTGEKIGLAGGDLACGPVGDSGQDDRDKNGNERTLFSFVRLSALRPEQNFDELGAPLTWSAFRNRKSSAATSTLTNTDARPESSPQSRTDCRDWGALQLACGGTFVG